MVAYDAAGRRWDAVAVYESLRSRLDDEYAAAPDVQTTTLYRRLLTGEADAVAGGLHHLVGPVPPRIDHGYYREPDDLDRIVEGLQRARELGHVGAIKELSGGVEFGPGPEVDLRSWVRRETWTYHHPVGTCAMGVDPSAGALVDPACRVHCVDGLWVVDAFR
jgi:choline dehydrogenase-like flavoprotein